MTGVAADIRKNFNLFIAGKSYVGKASEFNAPELEEENQEYRAAGMDMAIDVSTGMKKLTADFTLNSHSKEVLALYGVSSGTKTVFIVREAMESFDGSVTAVVHTMEGKIIKISQGTSKPGEPPKDKYDLSLVYYKQEIGGKVVHEIDAMNTVRIIDGVNVLAEITNALGI